jgi:uncharacterized membrane protein (UPF0127 family)
VASWSSDTPTVPSAGIGFDSHALRHLVFYPMKKILLYYFTTLFLLTGCTQSIPDDTLTKITVKDKEIKVEIMDTPALRAQGLSGKESLPQDQGMLFIFDNYSTPGFWMKEMNFPIDIIWIKDDKILDITKNIPPPATPTSTLPSYFPQSQINYVLEVNANWTNQNNIQIGDNVQF